MVLGTAVDSNVMSYPMLVIMKKQGVVVGRGGTSPGTSSEAEPALGGGAYPRTSGDAEPALRRRVRRSQFSDIERGEDNP